MLTVSLRTPDECVDEDVIRRSAPELFDEAAWRVPLLETIRTLSAEGQRSLGAPGDPQAGEVAARLERSHGSPEPPSSASSHA